MRMSRKYPDVKRYPAIEFLGWAGVVVTLGAYAAVSLGFLLPGDTLYPLLNLFSGVAIGIETYVHKDSQPFWLNVIWALIALVALVRIFIA